MPLNYDKINVAVNGKYILSESVSINQESPQKPLYSLNKKSPYDNSPTNLRNSINMSYLIEPSQDPAYLLISGWKQNNTTGNLTCSINIGDVFITGYLNNYSFDIIPNQGINAQASYLSFVELTGNFTNQNPDNATLYNLQNSTGIAHYWSANLTSGTAFTNIDNHNILQLNYSFTSNILPSYKLGSAFPAQVSVLDAVEEINIVNEVQNNILFSGQSYDRIFNGVDNVRLKNLSSLWGDVNKQIDFSISGFEVNSSKNDIGIDNLVLFTHNLKRFY
jgi:hypothetical protein